MKKYGEDFLTKIRYSSKDLNKVDKSWFQYRQDDVDKNLYHLSLLGILNLEPLPWRLQVTVDEDMTILGYSIRKRGY